MGKYLFIILSIFMLSGCFGEYFEHWDAGQSEINISTHSGDALTGTLFILPDQGVLRTLVTTLEHAKKRIWIETYTWTEKETQEAVIRAKGRGLDVEVILEGNVYETPRINDPIIERLKKKDIEAQFASDDFTFTHMKLWIVDDTWCISTGNWSFTSFTKNREFIFCSQDPSMLRSVEEVFQADKKQIRPIFREKPLDSRIGLAPYNMRTFLEEKIKAAQKEIIVYNQSISDPEILGILGEKLQNGLSIELCQSIKSSTGGQYYSIPFFQSEKPYLHAKVFLIDGTDIILGSTNITTNAIDNNREIMIFIDNNREIFTKIKGLYNMDCKKQP